MTYYQCLVYQESIIGYIIVNLTIFKNSIFANSMNVLNKIKSKPKTQTNEQRSKSASTQLPKQDKHIEKQQLNAQLINKQAHIQLQEQKQVKSVSKQEQKLEKQSKSRNSKKLLNKIKQNFNSSTQQVKLDDCNIANMNEKNQKGNRQISGSNNNRSKSSKYSKIQQVAQIKTQQSSALIAQSSFAQPLTHIQQTDDMISNRSSLSINRIIQISKDFKWVNPQLQAENQSSWINSYKQPQVQRYSRQRKSSQAPQQSKQAKNSKDSTGINKKYQNRINKDKPRQNNGNESKYQVPRYYTYVMKVKKGYQIGRMSIFQGILETKSQYIGNGGETVKSSVGNNNAPKTMIKQGKQIKLSCRNQLVPNPQSISVIYINKKIVEVGADEYLVGGNLEYINSCTGDNNDDIDHDAPGIVKIVEKSNNR